MQVKEIMTTNFEMINSTESIIDAAKKMRSFNIGVLPVKEDNKIIGMINTGRVNNKALYQRIS